MIRTSLKTVDGLTIYDLDPLASDLWAIAGPDGYIGEIDTDNLPEGFRWVTEQEWASLQDAINKPPKVEVCACVEWVRENDLDHDGIDESDLDEATNTYISAVITGLIDKGFEVTPAKNQRMFYHGWNGAHFPTRCGCVASWQDLTEDQKTAIADVRIEAQKKTTADWTLKKLSLLPEPVRFTYEVDGKLSIAGQDAAYGVCTACNHENISQATSSDWESVCADCGKVLDKVDIKTQ